MFGLFKEKISKVVEIVQTITIDEQEIIKKIHNEFDTASEREKQEMEQLLSSLNILTESDIEKKAERLKSLGFVSSETVAKGADLERNRIKSEIKAKTLKSSAELLDYYIKKYPFQKFLSFTELERICKKYNLVFAPVANYKMDVPEKNLQDIERAQKLDKEDQLEKVFSAYHLKRDTQTNKDKRIPILLNGKSVYTAKEADAGIINFEKQREARRLFDKNKFIEEHGIDTYYRNREHLELRTSIPYNYERGNIGSIDRYGYNASTKWLKELNKQKIYSENAGEGISHDRVEVDIHNRSGLFICAPKSEFDLSNLKQSEFGYTAVSTVEIKDPIVFEFCEGNICRVITKWGLESSDEALINPINN